MNDWERLHRQAEEYKESYPPGTRVMLLHMNDPYHPIDDGMRGTVDHEVDQEIVHFIYEQLKYYRERPPRFMVNQVQSEFGISSPQEAISRIPTDRFYSLVLNEVLEYWGHDGSSFARKHIPFQLIESGYFEPEEQTFGEIKMT